MNPPLLTLKLGSLDVPFDKNPVKLLLNIENPFARRFAYPVLATRYPTQFLMELESGSIQKTYVEVESSGEFVRLLDTFSFDFPERKVELNAIIPQSLIEKERQKYKTQFGVLP